MAENEKKLETERGGISVDVEHIFPIIKKWLYSEKEIFLREIVSNACDAVTKLRRLISLGEARDLTETEPRIRVILDKDAKTITVTDNGIGMTEEELRKYICQIALSGALEFIEKYESKDGGAEDSGIIGHFGLGFYSAFMVSERVELLTRSYTGAPMLHWDCTEDGDYEIGETDDGEGLVGDYGTAVIMHVSGEGEEFLSAYKLREVLDKYCAFMPVEIYFEDTADEEKEDDEKETPKSINDIHPLWQKNPSECTDEEYRDFYRKVFHDYKEPLFWIHLRADYPLNFKGILYFPRIGNEYESLEGQVKLFYNQVFVAENIKEVIPEYLLMLKGVLDCPELPLNVSRSYLQNNAYVSKISSHIVKKVSDKLTGMFSTDRAAYERIWRDLKTFVEYGCMRDRKFYDRVKGALLYELCDGKFVTVDEYLEAAKEKHEGKIYYANDKTAQSKYISLYAAEGIDVVLFDKIVDTQFITTVESAETDKKVKFVRVDAEVGDALSDGAGEKNEEVEKIFHEIAGEKTKITFEKLKNDTTPAILNIAEESRRLDDLMKLYAMDGAGMPGMAPVEETLILNSGNALVAKIGSLAATDRELAKKIAGHVYQLSLISQRQLSGEELCRFLDDSYALLERL